MLETSESLFPQKRPLKVCVVLPGPNSDALKEPVGDEFEAEECKEEMRRLLDTVGVEIVFEMQVSIKKIQAAFFIGQGKLDELKRAMITHEADAVVFDFELTPNQLRNLEKYLEYQVVDRPGVIIEIFSRHARTSESKTQVELAKLQYLLPRLRHLWTHFERQRGGGSVSRGMGETQIEVDRRLVKKRIEILRTRLTEIQKERAVQRQSRRDICKVAIVGYTNAGKSTLLNALTQSLVKAEDKLFATLDSSVRLLNPDSHPAVVMIDTVGFIKRLPPALIASFRSTLEEIEHADLLLHVVDGSSKKARDQLETTEKVLEDIGVGERPRMVVLNKGDLISPSERNKARFVSPGATIVSSLDDDDMKKLRAQIMGHFQKEMPPFEVVIPYTEGRIEAMIHAHGQIEKKKHLEKGTFYRIRMPDVWIRKLKLSKFQMAK